MPCATRLIHCAWFEQWYPRLKCTITTCQKCSIIYSHLSLPRQKLPWTLRRVGTQFSATHAENCQWEQGVLIICFFLKQTGQPIENIFNKPVLPGVWGSGFGCLDSRVRTCAAAHETLPRRCGGSQHIDPCIQSQWKGPALNVGSIIWSLFWGTHACGRT